MTEFAIDALNPFHAEEFREYQHPASDDLRATPLTENCERVFATAQHITVGISPFNSYFSLAGIHQILEWALAHFAYVDVFLPGIEAQNSLMACGYSETDARRSATRAINKMRNRAVSALLELGVDDVTLIAWSTVCPTCAVSLHMKAVGRRLTPHLKRIRTFARVANRCPTGFSKAG